MSGSRPQQRPRATDFWDDISVQTSELDEGPTAEPTDLATAQSIDREYNDALRVFSAHTGKPPRLDQACDNDPEAQVASTMNIDNVQHTRRFEHHGSEPQDNSMMGSATYPPSSDDLHEIMPGDSTAFNSTRSDSAHVDPQSYGFSTKILGVQYPREEYNGIYRSSIRPEHGNDSLRPSHPTVQDSRRYPQPSDSRLSYFTNKDGYQYPHPSDFGQSSDSNNQDGFHAPQMSDYQRLSHDQSKKSYLRPHPSSSALFAHALGMDNYLHPSHVDYRPRQRYPASMEKTPPVRPSFHNRYRAENQPPTRDGLPTHGTPPHLGRFLRHNAPQQPESSYVRPSLSEPYNPSQTPLFKPAQLENVSLPQDARSSVSLQSGPLTSAAPSSRLLAAAPPPTHGIANNSTANAPSSIAKVAKLNANSGKPAASTSDSNGMFHKLCNNHHLRGVCVLRENCNYIHGTLSETELMELKRIAKGVACKYGLDCGDPLCYCGHKCPYPLCNGKCKFPDEMHYDGPEDNRGRGMASLQKGKPRRRERSDRRTNRAQHKEKEHALIPKTDNRQQGDNRQRTPSQTQPLKRQGQEMATVPARKNQRASYHEGPFYRHGTSESEVKSLGRKNCLPKTGRAMLPPDKVRPRFAEREHEYEGTQVGSPASSPGGVRLESRSPAGYERSLRDRDEHLQINERCRRMTYDQRHWR